MSGTYSAEAPPTGQPIAGAVVSVTDSLSIVHTTFTDTAGQYSVPAVSQGAYSGTITLPDYSTYSFAGTLTAGQTLTVNGHITLRAPVISAVTSSNITGYSATIGWITDQSSSSTVEYGTTTSYGSSVADPALTTDHSMSINNLTPGTIYHFRVTSTNSHDASSSSPDNSFTSVAYPAITGIIVSSVTTTGATINWTTDQASDSLVSYGTTTAYGTVVSDPTMTTNHSITLANLTMQTQYHFTVTSNNAYGLSSTSADSTLTTASPITVTITYPSDGATISRPDIMVKGTITNSSGNETGVVVNGVVATVYGDEFVANHVPLTQGANTITVNATDTAGYTATASITITAAAVNYITLSSNIESGISVLESTLRIDGYASGTTPSISYSGPGTVDWTNCTSYEACKVKMTAEGVYYFTATGTGADGNTYQDTAAITVVNRAEMDALLTAKWNGMKTALSAGNIEEAVSYFAESSKTSFRYRFNLLAAQLPQIVIDMGLFRMVGVTEYLAEYDLRAMRNGTTYSYQVLFMRDLDGIWMIRSF